MSGQKLCGMHSSVIMAIGTASSLPNTHSLLISFFRSSRPHERSVVGSVLRHLLRCRGLRQQLWLDLIQCLRPPRNMGRPDLPLFSVGRADVGAAVTPTTSGGCNASQNSCQVDVDQDLWKTAMVECIGWSLEDACPDRGWAQHLLCPATS